METKQTKGQIKSSFLNCINENAVFTAAREIEKIPVGRITENNLARIACRTKELEELKMEIKALVNDIKSDYEEYKSQAFPKRWKYKNNESSFRQFHSLKKEYALHEFLKKNDWPNENEYFTGIGTVLCYEQFSHIYVIKGGTHWEHEEGVYSKCKYFYTIDDQKYFESDDLEKVERAMFKCFLKHQKSMP